MFLTKNGITFEVTHPNDIKRLKAAGYVQTKPDEPEKPAAEKPKEKAVKDGA